MESYPLTDAEHKLLLRLRQVIQVKRATARNRPVAARFTLISANDSLLLIVDGSGNVEALGSQSDLETSA